jgi:hypothetical protein
MKVTRTLIEKYHKGDCSPEESAAVESWLTDDHVDMGTPAFTSDAARASMKQRIWQEVRPVLPFYKRRSTILSAAAAVLVLCLLRFLPHNPASVDQSGDLNTPAFSIEFGKESNATFNSEQGAINFCGTIKIIPKKDIHLSFHTTCTDGTTRTKEIFFKEGEAYIALHYKDKESSEMLVINENMLFELPPMIKNQLSEQFKI